MKAAVQAGKMNSQVKAGSATVMVCCVLPAFVQAQEQAVGAHRGQTSIDQIEQLMSEQLAAQSQRSEQIKSLRLQIDSQTLEDQTQDWQLAGGLAGALLIALGCAWLFVRWPKWQVKRQALQSERRSKQPVVKRASSARPHASSQDQVAMAFQGNHLQNGEKIDHSGQGVVKRLVRQKKWLQKKLHKEKQPPSIRESAPDSEWLAQLDELDSQFLADDALREYELRKTVGLLDDADESTSVAERKNSTALALGVDEVWHSLQEVPLEHVAGDATAKASGKLAPNEAVGVDVSLEVQRVRKALGHRRKQRNLQALAAHENGDAEVDLDFELPASQAVTQVQPSDAMPTVADADAEIAPDTDATCAQPQGQLMMPPEQEQSDRFSPSVRELSDAETRLALAHEFQKLGQPEEAAQLCEEVLATGSAEERIKAQKYLRQLPGR